jgi:hypothetical protein
MIMNDDMTQQKVSERPEHVKPAQADQQTLQSKAKPVAQSVERTAPGRKPLFRT